MEDYSKERLKERLEKSNNENIKMNNFHELLIELITNLK